MADPHPSDSPTSDSQYALGAQVTAYKSDHYNRDEQREGSEFERFEFKRRDEIVVRMSYWLAAGFDEDEMEMLVFLDAEKATARVVRSWSDELREIVSAARSRLTQLNAEKVARAEAERIASEKRRAEATERAERSNYERLKEKYGR